MFYLIPKSRSVFRRGFGSQRQLTEYGSELFRYGPQNYLNGIPFSFYCLYLSAFFLLPKSIYLLYIVSVSSPSLCCLYLTTISLLNLLYLSNFLLLSLSQHLLSTVSISPHSFYCLYISTFVILSLSLHLLSCVFSHTFVLVSFLTTSFFLMCLLLLFSLLFLPLLCYLL